MFPFYQEGFMVQSSFQEQFNNSIVTALLFINLPLNEKERKLQGFLNEHDERYDIMCDNIYRMLISNHLDKDPKTLYLTIDGFSFVSDSTINRQLSCFPVLTINQRSAHNVDISVFVEIALQNFLSHCEQLKRTQSTFDRCI